MRGPLPLKSPDTGEVRSVTECQEPDREGGPRELPFSRWEKGYGDEGLADTALDPHPRPLTEGEGGKLANARASDTV